MINWDKWNSVQSFFDFYKEPGLVEIDTVNHPNDHADRSKQSCILLRWFLVLSMRRMRTAWMLHYASRSRCILSLSRDALRERT